MPPESAAVLTGDLIGSTRVEPPVLERAMATLAAAAGAMEAWPGGAGRFTRYRGDGWQMHVAAPGLALRCALTLTAALRAADLGLATRAAIGIGAVGSLGSESLADARGPAFEASGHALDAMGRGRRLAVAGDVSPLHGAVVDLLDERSGRWTASQAEATALYIAPDDPTLADLAARLGITAQAVNYRLAGAGAPALRRTLETWEAGWPAGAHADA
jgi:hypothetical protein